LWQPASARENGDLALPIFLRLSFAMFKWTVGNFDRFFATAFAETAS
jgi:hypothetical protein